MSSESAEVQELFKKLEQYHQAYLTTLHSIHERLAQALPAYEQPTFANGPIAASIPSGTATSARPYPSPPDSGKQESVLQPPLTLGRKRTPLFSLEDSDSSESDDDESSYVQGALPSKAYSQNDLKAHLRDNDWKRAGRWILDDVLRQQKYDDHQRLFEDVKTDDPNDADHISGDVYLVKKDGAYIHANRAQPGSGPKVLWDALHSVNTDIRQDPIVGKIAILREPSPLLFSAIHLTMKDYFDMDFIFRILVDDNPTKAYMKGYLEMDTRHQRSFIFSFKYHTIVGINRTPMPWQQSDVELNQRKDHIPISTCASVVALSFAGSPVHQIRRRARDKNQTVAHVFDPFSPRQILNIQCYPDWLSSDDIHDSPHRYVNGPEAFLITILGEYRDASKRFMQLNRAIVRLVTPPRFFMFDSGLIDQLLFENRDYSYSRRYFWAFQTFALLNDEIEAMITQYHENLTEEVWSGEHKYIWPGTKDKSAKYQNWRKRMVHLQHQFEKEIKSLKFVLDANRREQKDIDHLREQLFSGTSVQESRQAVRMAEITVSQGQNIRLLTLVSIFFLPLTFVTSVFGMTNMDPHETFKHFGIVVGAICVPTYLLIGLVEGKSTERAKRVYRWLGLWLPRQWQRGGRDKGSADESKSHNVRRRRVSRSRTMHQRMMEELDEKNDTDAAAHRSHRQQTDVQLAQSFPQPEDITSRNNTTEDQPSIQFDLASTTRHSRRSTDPGRNKSSHEHRISETQSLPLQVLDPWNTTTGYEQATCSPRAG